MLKKNKTVVKKPSSAADFRKADIASTQAFNKAGGQPKAPSFSAGTTTPAGLSGYGINDIMKLLAGTGRGGSGLSAKDRADIALERRKLNAANRQFNQELGLKREQMGLDDEISRGQLGVQQGQLGLQREQMGLENEISRGQLGLGQGQLDLQREQFNTEQQRLKDELTRRQGGLDKYIASLTGMIEKGPDVSALTNALSGLKTGAQTQITSAYDEMAKALQGITNPFAGYQAQAVSSPTAGLEQFLSSQGAGGDDLARFAQLQQAQSQQQATAANNLMAQLGGLFTGAQQSRQAEMAQGRTADLGTLGLNEMLLGTQIQQQGKSDIDKLREMLLAAQLQRAGL